MDFPRKKARLEDFWKSPEGTFGLYYHFSVPTARDNLNWGLQRIESKRAERLKNDIAEEYLYHMYKAELVLKRTEQVYFEWKLMLKSVRDNRYTGMLALTKGTTLPYDMMRMICEFI